MHTCWWCTLGKNDAGVVESFRDNAFFTRTLGWSTAPSSPTLRQLSLTDFGVLACGYTPVDLDTFTYCHAETARQWELHLCIGKTWRTSTVKSPGMNFSYSMEVNVKEPTLQASAALTPARPSATRRA